MSSFMISVAAFILAMVAFGLVRVLRGPTAPDRMMASQLLGTGGIAALLLLAVATADNSLVDLALTFALLSAFASIALVIFASPANSPGRKRGNE